MDTFTIREAAERCDVTYQAMRKRVDRGTIDTVKRDGVRLIPKVALERAGLWPGSQPQLSDSTELASLRAELAQAHAELEQLRPVPAQLDAERQARELAEQALHQQRAAAIAAEARRADAERERQTALEPLTDGGFISSVRALRTLRSRERAATTPGVPAAA